MSFARQYINFDMTERLATQQLGGWQTMEGMRNGDMVRALDWSCRFWTSISHSKGRQGQDLFFLISCSILSPRQDALTGCSRL